jgi:peptide-methionine (S)-S-oxide reductase
MSQTATFAAGCFWGVEDAFRKVKGVLDAAVGYSGGHVENPTYKLVCTDTTGHAESVRITFDPQTVSYEQLLEVFWAVHDPTQVDRQGPDVGTQYRSVIFYHDEAQKEAAERSKAKEQERLGRPIATQIVPASAFYRAEEYHQRYDEKHGIACHVIDMERVGHLLKD